MTKAKLLVLFFISNLAGSISSIASTNTFNFNYKNLNSMTSLICESLQPSKSFNRIIRSEISINKVQLTADGSKVNYEISGHCNSIYSKTTKSLLKLGDEINITAKLYNTIPSINGEIGLNNIKISFKNNSPYSLIVANNFTLLSKSFDLKYSNWAKNDSTFSFKKDELLILQTNNKRIIKEKDLSLRFASNHAHYNIWSFNSFGCASKTAVSKKSCEDLGRDS